MKDIDEEKFVQTTEIMLKLGLQPKMAGFAYMRECILLSYYLPDANRKLTKEIYPKVAEKYETTVIVVERGIRTLINGAVKNYGLLNLNEIYGIVVYTEKDTISNGELIAIIVELLRINKLKKELA